MKPFLHRFHIVCLLLFTAVLTSCERQEQQPSTLAATKPGTSGKPLIYVSNYPLKYFAERIAGDTVQIVFPVPADEDPAYWQPGADDILAFQKADLILFNGATYEKWAVAATLPESRIVDTSKSFEDRWLLLEHATTHSHGPGGEHSHTGIDFNTWLDPNLAILQAAAIRDALARLNPDSADVYTTNFEALRTDLESLDQELRNFTRRKIMIPILASHPVYGYLAKAYGLNVRSFLWEPSEMPTEDAWKEFGKIQSETGARWMIWEDEPAPPIAAKLAEFGVTPIPFRTCNNIPGQSDYLSVMHENIKALSQPWGGSEN